jgi:hypothetical protein
MCSAASVMSQKLLTLEDRTKHPGGGLAYCMYDSTTVPTSDQLEGRTPPARLEAIPGRLALAAHRRRPRRDQRGRQPVAQPG